MRATSLRLLAGLTFLVVCCAPTGAPFIQTFLPPLDWRALGIQHPVADPTHRPLACGLDGALSASNDTGRVKTEVSSDHMRLWVTIASPTLRLPIHALWVTQTGASIANAGSSLYRSADAGTTWTRVLGLTGGRPVYADRLAILHNGWTQRPGGSMYVAVYTTAVGGYAGGQAPVYASANDSQTWTVHSTLPTSIGNVHPLDPTTVRYLHGMAVLPSGLWLLTGDVGLEVDCWQWEQQRWVRKSPSDPDVHSSQRWRTVSVQEREGWLYWGRDSGSGTPGEIGYAPVRDLAHYQQRAPVQTGVHFSTQMRNGLLLFGGSVEGGRDETEAVVRVWAGDNGHDVDEVFTVAKSPYGGVRPSDKITGGDNGGWVDAGEGGRFQNGMWYVSVRDVWQATHRERPVVPDWKGEGRSLYPGVLSMSWWLPRGDCRASCRGYQPLLPGRSSL